jgi:hypothetical protein
MTESTTWLIFCRSLAETTVSYLKWSYGAFAFSFVAYGVYGRLQPIFHRELIRHGWVWSLGYCALFCGLLYLAWEGAAGIADSGIRKKERDRILDKLVQAEHQKMMDHLIAETIASPRNKLPGDDLFSSFEDPLLRITKRDNPLSTLPSLTPEKKPDEGERVLDELIDALIENPIVRARIITRIEEQRDRQSQHARRDE